MEKDNLFEEFTNQYSLSKTLRFALEPVGKTKDLIREIKEKGDFENPLFPLIYEDEQKRDFENSLFPLIYEDKQKAKAYKKVKQAIDDLHRDFLSFALDEKNFSDEDYKNLKEKIKEKIKEFYEKYSENRINKKNLKNKNNKENDKITKQIDNNTTKIIEIQKELAKQLKSILDKNAPEFLERKSYRSQKEYPY